MSLFIAKLSPETQVRDLEDMFSKYGKLVRCDLKRGYAFVDYESKNDAEIALRECNGKDLFGYPLFIDWAKGAPRPKSSGCFRCGNPDHFARDCPEPESGYDHRDYRPRRYGSRHGHRHMRSLSRSRSPHRRHYHDRSSSISRSKSPSRYTRYHPRRSPSAGSYKSRSPLHSHENDA